MCYQIKKNNRKFLRTSEKKFISEVKYMLAHKIEVPTMINDIRKNSLIIVKISKKLLTKLGKPNYIRPTAKKCF